MLFTTELTQFLSSLMSMLFAGRFVSSGAPCRENGRDSERIEGMQVRKAHTHHVKVHAAVPPCYCTSVAALSRRHLTLSTNNIEKVAYLASLTNLEILSLARNQIKKLEGFDPLGETLHELWISYNLLEKLVGVLRERLIPRGDDHT